MKKILTPVAILVSTFAVTAAHAEAKVDYFAGVDAGVNFGGKTTQKNFGYKLDQKAKAAPVYGIHGGITIDDHHRVTLGYNHSEQEFKKAIDSGKDTIPGKKSDVDTVKLQYDYVYGLTNNINLTGGAHLGYQWYGKAQETGKGADKQKVDEHMNGMIYGLQTGLEYNLDQWTFGTEIGYSWKDQKTTDTYNTNYKNSGEGTFLTSVSYHF
ncbi:hypothetical protein UA32_04285 [Photobacterium angustum]|uniref:Outer membrane protein beta-barrel domain-containing protein n=1 Tax=Photobacterium angustum TaxID=661 RepID=A0ABX5H545_PHOAN|nr:outer membrane beta-barrel protein [Photobacterium angustum]KJG39560.1 hypothetical protein UA32_04285 [Photobacterium angustum]PSX10473.1 hypothetical protein C0W27_10600 [Photobacterium angustum]